MDDERLKGIENRLKGVKESSLILEHSGPIAAELAAFIVEAVPDMQCLIDEVKRLRPSANPAKEPPCDYCKEPESKCHGCLRRAWRIVIIQLNAMETEIAKTDKVNHTGLIRNHMAAAWVARDVINAFFESMCKEAEGSAK